MAIEPVISIPFEEYDTSPTEMFSEGPLSARMQIVCAWGSRFDLAAQLKGGTQTIGGLIVYTLPWKYPHDPSGLARVVGVSIQPEGEPIADSSDNRLKSWQNALLTVDFATTQVSTSSGSDDDYIIEDTFGGFSDTLFVSTGSEGAGLLWWTTEDGTSANRLDVRQGDSPSRRVNGFRWTRTITGLTSVNTAIVGYSGSVNDRPYTILADVFGDAGYAAPAETLLLESFGTNDVFQPDGEKRFRLILNFVFQNLGTAKTPETADTDGAGAAVSTAGWNHAFPPGSSTAERIWISNSDTSKASIFKAYPPINFANVSTLWE